MSETIEVPFTFQEHDLLVTVTVGREDFEIEHVAFDGEGAEPSAIHGALERDARALKELETKAREQLADEMMGKEEDAAEARAEAARDR